MLRREAPPGRILADYLPAFGGYTVTACGETYVVRFRDYADFVISPGRTIDIHLLPEADAELVPILLTGNVLAVVLALDGECVLHASAVEFDGGTLAIVGGPGMGKSTLAAVFCAAGGRLISDDLLRVGFDEGRPYCFEGTGLIRLRESAAELAQSFPPDHVERTADGRMAVKAEKVARPTSVLDAIIVPEPSRTATVMHVDALGPRDSLVTLISYPRVMGWQVIEPSRHQFVGLAELARKVPVYRVEIPWGPPFSADAAARLAVELDLGRESGRADRAT